MNEINLSPDPQQGQTIEVENKELELNHPILEKERMITSPEFNTFAKRYIGRADFQRMIEKQQLPSGETILYSQNDRREPYSSTSSFLGHYQDMTRNGSWDLLTTEHETDWDITTQGLFRKKSAQNLLNQARETEKRSGSEELVKRVHQQFRLLLLQEDQRRRERDPMDSLLHLPIEPDINYLNFCSNKYLENNIWDEVEQRANHEGVELEPGWKENYRSGEIGIIYQRLTEGNTEARIFLEVYRDILEKYYNSRKQNYSEEEKSIYVNLLADPHWIEDSDNVRSLLKFLTSSDFQIGKDTATYEVALILNTNAVAERGRWPRIENKDLSNLLAVIVLHNDSRLKNFVINSSEQLANTNPKFSFVILDESGKELFPNKTNFQEDPTA